MVLTKLSRGLTAPHAKAAKKKWRDQCTTKEVAKFWIEGSLASHLGLRAASATGRVAPSQVIKIKTEEIDAWAGQECGNIFCNRLDYKALFEREPTIDELSFHRWPKMGTCEGVMVDPADPPLPWRTSARLPAGCTQLMRTF